MQRLEVSGEVRPLYGSLGVKRLILKNKYQLDATYYFTELLIGSTCFGHYYAHHQQIATIMLITTLAVSFLVCWSSVRAASYSLKPGHYSSLIPPNFQSTATQERDDQCGN